MENKRRPKRAPRKQSEYIDKVIEIKPITKVTKGGRQRRFSALVVVGNKKGKVGIGQAKADEVPEAIKKALKKAEKNVVNVPIVDGRTIPHEIIGVQGSAKVMLKPASKGTGVKAGGPVRAVLELAGVHDILSKSLGSTTKTNTAKATLNALVNQKTVEKVAALRGKTVEELIG